MYPLTIWFSFANLWSSYKWNYTVCITLELTFILPYYILRFINVDAYSCSSLIFTMDIVFHSMNLPQFIHSPANTHLWVFWSSFHLKRQLLWIFLDITSNTKCKSFSRVSTLWAIANLWDMHSLQAIVFFQNSYNSVYSEAIFLGPH